MDDSSRISSKYVYIHEMSKWGSQTVDIHHVVVRNRVFKRAVCFSLVALLLNVFYVMLGQGTSTFVLGLYLVIGAVFITLLRRRVVKESVVIIPSFGVQLETHYGSGRAMRHFVPMDKILKPLLNECVTPVTCYWSLALMLRDEDKLMLVFRKLKPPLEMLAPIWKALCTSTDSGDSSETIPDAC